MIGAFLALTAVIVLGVEILGSTRTLFSGSVQPAEPAQIIIIVYVSAWLASKGERIRSVGRTRIVYRDGVPIAVLEGDVVRELGAIDPGLAVEVSRALTPRRSFALAAH